MRVLLGVEVIGRQQVAHQRDRLAVDQDAAQHRLLGLDVVRWHAHSAGERAPGIRCPHQPGVGRRHCEATTIFSVSVISG